jgi:hypothetical protein
MEEKIESFRNLKNKDMSGVYYIVMVGMLIWSEIRNCATELRRANYLKEDEIKILKQDKK